MPPPAHVPCGIDQPRRHRQAVPQSLTEKADGVVRAAEVEQREGTSTEFARPQFTEKMKEEGYTILAPQMAPRIISSSWCPSSSVSASTWSFCLRWITARSMRA